MIKVRFFTLKENKNEYLTLVEMEETPQKGDTIDLIYPSIPREKRIKGFIISRNWDYKEAEPYLHIVISEFKGTEND